MTIDIKGGSGAPSRRRLLQGGARPELGRAGQRRHAEEIDAERRRLSRRRAREPALRNCRTFMPPDRWAVVEGACGPDGVCKLYYGGRL